MGTLDSNGIWRYDNNDQVTPLATFMNLLSTSVSNAISALAVSLQVPDSGWINLPLPSAVNPPLGSSYVPRYRKIGNMVYVEFRVVNIMGTYTVGTLPVGFRPTQPGGLLDVGNFAINDTVWRRIYVSNAGIITAGSSQGGTGSQQANAAFSFVAA